MRFILHYLRRHARDYLLGFLCLVATNLLTLAIPWILKETIEGLERGVSRRSLGVHALAMAGCAALLALIRTGSRLFILGASRRIVSEVRSRFFAHLVTLPASFYGRSRTGEIMSRGVNDLLLIRSMFGPGMLSVLNVVLLYGAGLAVMTAIDPTLTLAAVLPYPFLLLGVFRVGRTIHARSNATQEQLAEISNTAQENLSGIVLVKAFAREEAEIAAFDGLSLEYRRRSLRLAKSRGLVVTLMEGLGGVSTLVVLGLGGLHVVEKRLSIGGFIAFTTYLLQLTGPTIMMGWVLGVFQRGFGAIRRVEEILAIRGDLSADLPAAPPHALRGGIRVRGLSFSYAAAPGDTPRPALRGIDLEIAAGETVGIVGPVGAGKSTLAHLLAAIHPVPPGTIRFDGRDLDAIPAAHLRARLALVPQETFLFSRSIADNIALGDPGAPRARIAEAARLAHLTSDLELLPQGLDTRVGERGHTLSGGQRQRVALARALLVDPRVLILDDALSSVDAGTEEAILRGLRDFGRGRTVLFIAHRVSTVLHADRIVVLDDGRIVESGPPGDLLARDGPFADLHRRQQIESELEAM
ncbi:MAG: ABC transporter ATP-binding protein [Candidatus Polarisedimenticolia bacterium]